MANNLKKYMDVDVIALLEERMKRNTLHYQSDFEIDKEMIQHLAQSTKKEDKTLLWMSRLSGTHCHRESEVFTSDSSAHNTWRFFAEQMNDSILPCAVELKGIQNGVVRGNVYDLDFKALSADIAAKSVNSLEVEKTFEDGFVDRVPIERSSYWYYCDLVAKHGAVVDSHSVPCDETQLSSVLAEQKQNRDRMKEADFSDLKKEDTLEFIFDEEILVSDDCTRVEGYLELTDSLVSRLKAQESPLSEDQFMENINFYPLYNPVAGTISMEGDYYLEDGFNATMKYFNFPLSKEESAQLIDAFEAYCQKTERTSCSELLVKIKQQETQEKSTHASLDAIISGAQNKAAQAQPTSFSKEQVSERF